MRLFLKILFFLLSGFCLNIRNAPQASYVFVDEIFSGFEAGGINSVGKVSLWKTPEGKLVWQIADDVANGGNDLLAFVSKSLSQKLEEIATVWKTKYPLPEMFEGRTFFEQVMREYRYTKAVGWEYTADIASNFKGVDFYRDFFELENVITAKTAVSMKTTVTTDVNVWLKSEPIQKNIGFLKEGLSSKGLDSNGKIFKITENARVDIYMQKEKITPELLQSWQKELSKITTESGNKINFEIKPLEEFIK